MTTVCIMQPTYLPWVGYFDLLDQADTFVLLDNVPVSKQSWQTRNRIRARDGQVVWLSVPTNATPGMPLNEVRIANEHDWQAKHMRTLTAAYRPNEELWYLFDAWYQMPPDDLLCDFTAAVVVDIARALGIKTPIYSASSIGTEGDTPTERLEHLVHCLDATEYLSPQGSRGYLEGHDIGVPIRWHEYEHPVYDQGGADWVSHLSVVDLLAWHGPDSLRIIRSGRRGV